MFLKKIFLSLRLVNLKFFMLNLLYIYLRTLASFSNFFIKFERFGMIFAERERERVWRYILVAYCAALCAYSVFYRELYCLDKMQSCPKVFLLLTFLFLVLFSFLTVLLIETVKSKNLIRNKTMVCK